MGGQQRLALGVVGLLAACGSDPTPPIRTPTPRPNPSPGRTSAAIRNFPEAETPIATAPASLRQTWSRYGVTLIPSRHIFDGIPRTPPHLANHTAGAVDDATAAAWFAAEQRETTMQAWAEANTQQVFRQFLVGVPFRRNTIAVAISQGARVTDPPCSSYPATASLDPVDEPTQAFFRQTNQVTADRYQLVETYPGPCEVTATFPDGHRTSLAQVASGTAAVIFEAGRYAEDPVLGPIWFPTAAGNCAADGAPTTLCAAR